MKAILPTREQLSILFGIATQLRRQLPDEIIIPIIDRLGALERNILTEDDYRRISSESEVSQFEKIAELQRLTEDLPTRARFDEIIGELRSGQGTMDEKLDYLEELINSVDNRVVEGLSELKKAEIEQQRQAPIGYVDPESIWDISVPNLKKYKAIIILVNHDAIQKTIKKSRKVILLHEIFK
jgi:hypothetical protein